MLWIMNNVQQGRQSATYRQPQNKEAFEQRHKEERKGGLLMIQGLEI